MNTVYFDSAVGDDLRRERLYEGQLFVYGPRPSTLALVEHARMMLEEAFGDLDPLTAQFEMPVEEYVAICAPLKPAFIHNDRTKELVRAVVAEIGADLEQTYIDVPRLRMVTSDAYLTSGVGYAHHPHRDTWYSAPMAQFNWWLPIYDIESESSMAFHPNYWNRAVKNGSREFNYYEWNSVGRRDAAKQVKADTRKQPKPEEEMELEPELRLVMPAGGMVIFSAAHMHSTVPNTSGRSRYSIDFRTVNRVDLEAGRSAPNLDTECTGTSLRDFVRGTDGSQLPEELIGRYDSGTKTGELVFQP
jgi:Phytanoyl-CoA dioxygenase (PhyH)